MLDAREEPFVRVVSIVAVFVDRKFLSRRFAAIFQLRNRSYRSVVMAIQVKIIPTVTWDVKALGILDDVLVEVSHHLVNLFADRPRNG